MEINDSQEISSEEVKRAIDLIYQMMRINPELNGFVWVSALFTCLVRMHAGIISYDTFIAVLDEFKKDSKRWFKN